MAENAPKLIAFTWCPSPAYHDIDHIVQYNNTMHILRKIRFALNDDYQIFPELTINGNIHYHGMFSLKNRVYWYKTALPLLKRNGFVKVEAVKDAIKDKWMTYIRKECTLMKQLIPLSDDEFNDDGLDLSYKIKICKVNTPLSMELGKPTIQQILGDQLVDEQSQSTGVESDEE